MKTEAAFPQALRPLALPPLRGPLLPEVVCTVAGADSAAAGVRRSPSTATYVPAL